MEKKTITINDKKSQNATIGWKEVTIGGITGIVLGGASAYAASSMSGSDNESEELPVDLPEPETTDEVLASQTNFEEMTFDQAFAAAREEMGAGGTFVWHGQVYGTYYATEWNSMSPAEQQAFSEQALENNDIAYTPTQPAAATPAPEHHDTPATPATPATPEQHEEPEQPIVSQNEDEEVQVDILGFEQEVNDDGTVSNYGYANVGDTNVLFVDVDGTDDTFDFMVADFNGNNQIDDDEIIPIADANMSVSEFQTLAQEAGAPVVIPEEPIAQEHYTEEPASEPDPQEIGYVDPNSQYISDTDPLPDYMNDADPVDLA